MFYSKPNSIFNLFIFLVENYLAMNTYLFWLGFGFDKNRGLWSLIFKNLPRCPIGFSIFYNFVVFNFSQIRLLRASKSRFQKATQFYTKTDTFGLGQILRKITCTLPQTVATVSLRQTCNVLRKFSAIKPWFKPMQPVW